MYAKATPPLAALIILGSSNLSRMQRSRGNTGDTGGGPNLYLAASGPKCDGVAYICRYSYHADNDVGFFRHTKPIPLVGAPAP